MDAIRIQQLSKQFGKAKIIREIDLNIEKGAFFGLIGKNGAGKTTLINMLTGTVSKSEGSFWLFDTPDYCLDKIKHLIGVMPDTSALYDAMTGAEFLRYMAGLKKVYPSKSQLHNLLDDVCLDVPLEREIKNYSFGMKKKIAVAQALIGQPQLLFLDEPTSGVDPESILHLQKLFQKLNHSGVTIFFTSHNLNEVERLCTHIAILNHGVFQVNGGIQDIISDYSKSIRVSIECHIPANFSINEILRDVSLLESEKGRLVLEVVQRKQLAEVIKTLVELGVEIFSVQPKQASLEEIFLS